MSRSDSDSSSSYDLLEPRVRRWVWEKKWTELNDVQELSIPIILTADRDVIISAATGRGKTEAAFLPICSTLATPGELRGVGAVYISPLKALINDQFSRMESLCEAIDLPVHRWHGDVPGSRKQALLRRPSGVLLITPESLEALFVLRGPQVPNLFAGLKYIVVDELHSFIGSERGAQLRSLMHRLELATRHRVARIGLSATIGDLGIAAEFLRPGSGDDVVRIVSAEGGQELKVQLRGYRKSAPEPADGDDDSSSTDDPTSAERAVGSHLFKVLRGSKNLIFANSRSRVEEYADSLRRMSESMGLPQEFWPHHGNLSKEVREDVEGMLKEAGRPATAVCTSTLEMGIDIGEVASVAQVGMPPSVASLRQRLGRSGRRGGPAILRGYVVEPELDSQLTPQDALRTRLVTNVAMINLLIGGWVEPPASGARHLSTLVQQILSVIAQHGGVRANDCWGALCRNGPFPSVDAADFAAVLRSLASHDLLIQSHDGIILLGEVGEKLVNHYSFFSAFETPEEYSIVAGASLLGTLPVNFGLCVGTLIVFAGRRWQVTEIDERAKRLAVVPSPGGRPPMFDGGEVGHIHARVRFEMRHIYETADMPAYLDVEARRLLEEGRNAYRSLGLASAQILRQGNDVHLFPWEDDRVHCALALMLQERKLAATFDGVAVSVRDCSKSAVLDELRRIGDDLSTSPSDAAAKIKNAAVEKYDRYLPPEFVLAEFAARNLDVEGARRIAGALGHS